MVTQENQACLTVRPREPQADRVVGLRRCALYGRVSTARQAAVEDGGLDTQFGLMTKWLEYAKGKAQEVDWAVHDCYREEGWSGKNLERPEFKRMMADVRAGLVDVVIVQKIDRITRSLRDFYDLWEEFERHGVQFVSLHENFDSSTAIGRAMLKLILVFAELEREQTGERTAATMLHRAEQGLYNGRRILGYEPNPDDKGIPKVSDDQAALVLEIFQRCRDLGSAGKVVQHLQTAGHRKPVYTSRRGQQRGGKSFNKMDVIRVLTNPMYAGKVEHKGKLYDGRHRPIVPIDLFEEVQQILGKNRERRGNFRDQRAHVFLLQGLIRCGKCGSMMTPKSCTGRGGRLHFYYQCTQQSHSNGTRCDARYLPAEAAEEYLVAELQKWAMSDEEIRRVVELGNEQKDVRLKALRADEQRVIRDRQAVQSKIDNIVSQVEGGTLLKSLSDRLAELEEEAQGLDEYLAGVKVERNRLRQESLSLELIAETYKDFPAIMERFKAAGKWQEIKELIARYVSAIDWHQDTNDPSTGTIEIMLFEQAAPLHAGKCAHPDKPAGNAGASGCNTKLGR